MVCGQEKFPSPSCGQSASSGRPPEATLAVGRSKPRGRSLANELALRFRRRRRRFQFCIERFQSLGRLFLQLLQPCHSCGLAHGQPRVPFTTSCGFAASEPLPFPGANSVFSTCCGAISGRLRFCRQALSRRDSGDRNASVQRPTIGPAISAGTTCENKHRTATQLWQEICAARPSESDSPHMFLRIAIALNRHRRPTLIQLPHVAVRQAHGQRANILLEPLELTSAEQRHDPRLSR
jgi:hypothetical protein